MATDFDDWAQNAYNPKTIHSNKNGEIWNAPHFDKLMEIILNNEDIDTFIEQRNQDLHDQYTKERSAPINKEISEKTTEINNLQKFSNDYMSINAKLDEFEKDISVLIKHYPNQDHQYIIKGFLSSYQDNDGKFEKNYNYKKLMQKPKGFFNKIFHAQKTKKAQKYLKTFIEKYETLNIPNEIKKFSENKNPYNFTSDLKLKFNAITDRDNSTSYSNNIAQNKKKLDEQIISCQKNIKNNEKQIEDIEKNFINSETIPEDNKAIRSFCNEIRNEITHPQPLNSSDYVECLSDLPDDEIIMFNVGLKAGNNIADRTKNIMAYNGLEYGNETSQWMIREELLTNSDRGKYEIFSPLMTAKEAKQIIPKLMADLDRAHVSSGLAIPIKAKDIFKERTNNTSQTEITQEGLMELVGLSLDAEGKTPEYFKSLDELKQQYPKEQFLFSGSTASDDHLALSARVGRNGIIYATPDINYAAIYDGITSIGSILDGDGITATGDKYVSSTIGKLSNENVNVGFINIYEQNKDDIYFSNFGMEDYRASPNKQLKRDQAINGYLGDKASLGKDGKFEQVLSFDAETYVTPEKNPLKAKIMHIKWNGIERFVPVPDKPNETIQAILNSRQAKMEVTFSHNQRQDVLKRMQKQKEEFNQGILHPIRENDFTIKLQKQLNKKDTTLQQTKNITPENSSTSVSIGKQISDLRGTSSHKKPALVKQSTITPVNQTILNACNSYRNE